MISGGKHAAQYAEVLYVTAALHRVIMADLDPGGVRLLSIPTTVDAKATRS